MTTKLLTMLATVTTAVVLATAPAAAESTANTGTFGPAEEPSLAIPLVVAFVVVSLISAVIMGRGRRSDA